VLSYSTDRPAGIRVQLLVSSEFPVCYETNFSDMQKGLPVSSKICDRPLTQIFKLTGVSGSNAKAGETGIGNMYREPVDGVGPWSIAIHDIGCSSCLGLDRTSGQVWQSQTWQASRGTLEIEVRETRSYTVVVKYTDQATMNKAAHWANMASVLSAANIVAVTPKGWINKWNTYQTSLKAQFAWLSSKHSICNDKLYDYHYMCTILRLKSRRSAWLTWADRCALAISDLYIINVKTQFIYKCYRLTHQNSKNQNCEFSCRARRHNADVFHNQIHSSNFCCFRCVSLQHLYINSVFYIKVIFAVFLYNTVC